MRRAEFCHAPVGTGNKQSVESPKGNVDRGVSVISFDINASFFLFCAPTGTRLQHGIMKHFAVVVTTSLNAFPMTLKLDFQCFSRCLAGSQCSKLLRVAVSFLRMGSNRSVLLSCAAARGSCDLNWPTSEAMAVWDPLESSELTEDQARCGFWSSNDVYKLCTVQTRHVALSRTNATTHKYT